MSYFFYLLQHHIFLAFFHWIVFDFLFYCLIVKTIYTSMSLSMCTKCTLFYLFLEEKKHCKRKTWARRWITLFLLIFECTSFYENLGDVLMPINCRSAREKNCSRVDLISRPVLQLDRPKLNNYQRKRSRLEIFKKKPCIAFLA